MRGQPKFRTSIESAGSFSDRVARQVLKNLPPLNEAPAAGDTPEASSDPAQKRRLPRKRVLLNGVVTDVNGENAVDCRIRDLNVLGAQIAVQRELTPGTQIVLLNTSNPTAHVANVAWCNDGRAGLAFAQTHPMGLGLPPKLNFLWRLLLEAKLREIDSVVARGAPIELAISTVGLTENLLHCMSPHASAGSDFEQRLVYAKNLLNK